MKMGNIRRIIYAISILLLATTFFLNAALCEQIAWDCPECGRMGNTGNYCGNCAHPAPWMGTADNKNTESTQMDISAFQTINNIVTFGHYEQDNDLSNGPEEIEWIVLDFDEKDHKALLISRYGLDAKRYNEEWYGNTNTWENCTLRKWLNDEFLKEAFDTDEQVAIIVSEVKNSASQGFVEWNSYGGNNTKDQIFLLSYVEANQYFGVERNIQNIEARVAPTAYSIAQGAGKSGKSETVDGEAAGWWWLRSPGSLQRTAADVNADGSLGSLDVRSGGGVVRPAIWLNLESDIF